MWNPSHIVQNMEQLSIDRTLFCDTFETFSH